MLEKKLELLKNIVRDYGNLILAYSGGVDSNYLLHVACGEVGDRILPVIIESEFITVEELQSAIKRSRGMGLEPLVIKTSLLSDEEVKNNPPDRCYYCKMNIFREIQTVAQEKKINVIIEGSHASDLHDYRPGSRALDELGIKSPLKEAGFTKNEIRRLSHAAGLDTWNKPSAPCLATRIPYGSVITDESLERISRAEEYMHSLGFEIVRVRDYGTMARIEVTKDAMKDLINRDYGDHIADTLKGLGYHYIALDIEGYRMGSMNEIITREIENG